MSPRDHARKRRYLLYMALAGAASLGPLWLAEHQATGSSAAIDEPISRSAPVAAPGLVEPGSEEISVSNLLQGTLRRASVAEGDHVVAGQILAELDNDDLAATVAAATAQLDLRRSEREKLINGARAEEREEAAANLQAATSVAAMATMTLQRRTALVATHAATAESVDQASTDLRSAAARRDAMAARMTLINAPPRREDVAIADANIALAEANLRKAQAELNKSYIRAPIDGTVLRILRRVGEQVSATFPSIVMVMGDTRTLRVRTEIDETDIGRIKVGQESYITVDAYPGRRFPGVITKIAGRMGKKAVHTDDPSEKIDAKVLDVLVTLAPGANLPVGLRVDVFVNAGLPAEPTAERDLGF
jgi:HlyD family secretion protein